MQDRVVITGMGTINPIGHTVGETWENALNGVSGVGPITLFDTSNLLVHIACEVKDFEPQDYITYKQVRRMDRCEQLALAATQEALNQSGLVSDHADLNRVGVIVASAIGGITTTQNEIRTLDTVGPRRISPFAIPMLMSNGPAGMVAIEYGIHGPCFSIASACASGSDGIGVAWQLLQNGVIDAAITGASEATITDIAVATFDRLGAMSRRNEDYSCTPQPFDKKRDGLVMGEGAGILILERESYARKRGAEILAELAGYASTSDAFHITAPAEDGSGSARAMHLAMSSAGANPEDVDYINAHGTATELNDIAETRAIKLVFDDLAYNIPVSSTKSMTGHMMGATGALETIFCVQAVRNGIIPPTINYQNPDPQCDLDYVPNQPRQRRVEVALNNAFGFGGHNAVLVVRAYL